MSNDLFASTQQAKSRIKNQPSVFASDFFLPWLTMGGAESYEGYGFGAESV